MLKFSKILLVTVLTAIFAGCVFFNLAPNSKSIEIVEAGESIEYETNQSLEEDYQIYYSDGYSYVRTPYVDNTYNVFTGTEFIIDVALMNFNDYSAFTPSTYETYFQIFDEVSQYFNTFSRGKVDVKFNFYVGVYDSIENDFINIESSSTLEESIIDNIIEDGVCLSYSGESDGACLYIGSGKKLQIVYNGKITWPHCFMGTFPHMCFCLDISVAKIIHETIHMMGCGDLYNVDKIATYLSSEKSILSARQTDIMATGYNTKNPTTANSLERLGWLESSLYEDTTNTEIEIISTNGTYTLNNCDSPNGAIAYKFGIKTNEFFMVEQRYVGNDSYLVIQRINNLLASNYTAKDQSELYVLSFLSKATTAHGISSYFSIGDSMGGYQNLFYYSNEETANYYITNIKINEEGLIQFDFFQNFSQDIAETINIPQDEIINRNIYINVKDDSGSNLNLSSMLWYDSSDGTWKSFDKTSIVYVNNSPFYALFNMPENATKIKMQYIKFNTISQCEVELIENENQYFAVIKTNILQKTGDVFVGIKEFVIKGFYTIFNLFN